ncbi:calcium-binding protein [Roseovarius sp. CAU 1744]|uniref:calcium-binding protein n=1 Tax=Roseovarius sp. CAU 1744 TaxID=3140368 RepID=UPI00325BFDC2
MVQFTSSSVFANALVGPLAGISDLDAALFGDQWRLFATSRIENEISVFDVMAGELQESAAEVFATGEGQMPATGLEIVSTGTDTFAVFSGGGDVLHNAYDIDVTGSFGEGFALAPTSGLTSALTAIVSAQLEGLSLLATAQGGQSGFSVQSVNEDLTLAHVQSITVEGGEIVDIEMIEVGGTGLTLAIDRAGNEILSYRVANDGTLTFADTLGVMDGLGLVAPEILRVVNIAGQSFGIVAAGSSSSISVFEISDTGELIARDHVIDGQGTRFASISELEIVETNGRAFVLAAGADDGFTLLELLPDGRLIHHATIADSDAVTLQNVSGLAAQVQGNVLHVFAASATETGLTELTFDLGVAGVVEVGGADDDILTGGSGDDVLFGGHGAGHDVLSGGDGGDTLIAGQGADRLIGGQGADVFVFGDAQDGGRIDDFNVAEDLLDLSGWFLLHDTSQLNFVAYADRVDISFGGYMVSVRSHDGGTLEPAELIERITINPSHSIITNAPQAADLDSEHYGTSGNDVLFGHAGQDIFYSAGGRDVFVGGGEFDIVSYENATSRIKVDMIFGRRERGDVAKDQFFSIEGIEGTDFGDTLIGDHGQNWFDGGEGRDFIAGRSGDDDLRGAAGNDKLLGGWGHDTLSGGEGADILVGHSDNDHLNGDAGNDRLRGGGGDDTIIGGAGDDNLGGGFGADTFYFTEGNDWIKDFSTRFDLLYIDDALLSDPTMSAAEILSTYGEDLGRTVRLNFGEDEFGNDQMITLHRVRSLDDLSDSLFVF